MITPDTPSSHSNQDEDVVEDTLEALRARLINQRATQKASFTRHKQTTSLCIEMVRQSAIYVDPAVLQAKLDKDEDPRDLIDSE